MSNAKPLEGTVKSYDPKHRSGIIAGNAADYWFHADAHCRPLPAWNAPVFGKAPLRREPQAGDKVIFFPGSSCSGLKALRWAFADEYEKARLKMVSQKLAASQQELVLQPYSTRIDP